MSYGKKNEDGDAAFLRVDRTSVFQEARLFNSSPIQPRRCRVLLTKIALLLYTGERFPINEATTLFFGISKLFQNKDASLRQMVHLIIKELANSAEDIIMVTSTIMKDTGGGRDAIYRPNAIRALCRIIDASTVQSIERVMKTAIVDKNPSVSSAALVSSYHLLPIARDVVRRWQSETQEAASSVKSSSGYSLGFSSGSQMPANNSTMTQYHAIGLLYQMRLNDRMALVKMVQQFGTPGAIKSPAAILILVRLAAQLAEEDQQLRKPMMQLLDGWLRHKNEMVNFEAAKAICDMRDVTDAEVTQSIHVLQMFLTSPRAVGILRDEGGYDFKRAVVESMFDLIKFVPDSKEDALAHLCEFIEDCEFTKLAVRILHLLGLEGPKTSQPTKYIRYIYNRVVLENAIVRAAAVTALAKFGIGQKDAEVKRSVTVLLTRCLDDLDDEVRDRAAINLRLMSQSDDDSVIRFVNNELTESETEYVVTAVKHIFREHIVIQYYIKNTLPDTVLEDVSVVATPSDEDELEEDFIIPVTKLVTDVVGTVYVSFKKLSGETSFPACSFTNILKFTTKEIDPSTGEPEETGYDDEYQVEDLELVGSDYVIPALAGNFNHIWEQVGASGQEAEETLQLSGMSSIADATEQLIKTLCLQPLEGTDVPVNTSTHTLKLFGKTITGGRVAVNIRMAFSTKSGITSKIVVRADEEAIPTLILASVS
ncbi:hypothetical protein OnM2_031002 [Erysiphe neolycopersici]|uniref:Coatomer subunit gamma n=1 Tax=Erysiphe neolycopersici TaxID=212602 RepID=A0A420HZ08_9PEZI|nr:hypothetical protein OnM2_031002 [Erysiphe neolycopersici]